MDTLGVPERMPFILGDDGAYDLRLNQFLRELPTMGVRAEKSWLAYARDLVTWARRIWPTSGTGWPQPSARSEPAGRTAHELNDESDCQLRAAMPRLLAGTPIRSNGSLTVSALAVEAGVSRRTAGRAKGVPRDFQDAIAGRDRARGAELNTLACRVTLLSEENEQLRRACGTGPVVALPSGAKAGS